MAIPNLFIIGSFKCGTTALYQYLLDHPNIYMSQPKGPYFFAKDFPYISSIYVKSVQEYQGLFDDSKPHHTVLGEASAGYLYSSVAIKNIYKFNPNAKIIVMLRNPVDLVYSYHSQLLFDGDEMESDFKTAWELQLDRENGLHIGRQCKEPKFLQYKCVGQLGEQCRRVLEVFPKKQVKFILFDDFRANTRLIYEDVLKFLELPDDERQEFPVHNANKVYKNTVWSLLLQWRPLWLRRVRKRLMLLLGKDPNGELGIGALLSKRLVVKQKRQPLDVEFRNHLVDIFYEDIILLQEVTGYDLSNWLDNNNVLESFH